MAAPPTALRRKHLRFPATACPGNGSHRSTHDGAGQPARPMTSKEHFMPENLTTTSTELEGDGLLVARAKVTAARSRGEQPSDGGSTGRTDTND